MVKYMYVLTAFFLFLVLSSCKSQYLSEQLSVDFFVCIIAPLNDILIFFAPKILRNNCFSVRFNRINCFEN